MLSVLGMGVAVEGENIDLRIKLLELLLLSHAEALLLVDYYQPEVAELNIF